MEVIKKVLLIKLSALGDVIFTIPLANILKNNGYEVHWLVSEKGYNIVKNNPCVDKAILLPLYKWRKNLFSISSFFEFIKIITQLRREKYDISLDCQRRLKSLPYCLFCGAKRRIILKDGAKEGAVYGANEIAEPLKNVPPHMVYRNLSYAGHLGLDTNNIKFSMPPSSDETMKKVDEMLNAVDTSKPLVVVAPETTWETKHWDIENWKTVIDELGGSCNLIFTGNNPEFFNDSRLINLAGKTTMEDLVEIFNRVDVVISPDSGSAHLAWACQKPAIICLFMATSPSVFGCFGDNEKYFPIRGEFGCPPCFKRDCRSQSNKNICTKFPEAKKVVEICKSVLLVHK